jgi:tRNA (cytidine/uridine-2'-O-)-methyltransferase
MDYAELANVRVWDSLPECVVAIGVEHRWFAVSTKGHARYDEPRFVPSDVFLFGPETRGLPMELIEACPVERRLRIPMAPGNRSLNLSNAAAVVVYEAWRQLGFSLKND